MRWYIEKTFERASQTYHPTSKQSIENKDFTGKAIQRIPVCALNANQYNQKNIRAFFESVDVVGEATLPMLERLCSDKNHPELYVPTFQSDYAQMRLYDPKSHGPDCCDAPTVKEEALQKAVVMAIHMALGNKHDMLTVSKQNIAMVLVLEDATSMPS